MSDVTLIACKSPGMVNGDTNVEQLPDGTWLATAPIGCLFGSPVEGECRGTGDTQDAAIAALQADQDRLYESLWV